MNIRLIPANEKDIPEISALAKKIWNQYYPNIITQDQIDYMLHMMYCDSSLTEQITEKKHQFFLIQQDRLSIGFISVNEVSQGNWFLNKFYIDQSKASQGIGSRAFHQVMSIMSPSSIVLTVNRKNFKSINFYFKNGFTIKEVKDFDIGNGYFMEDFVMEWLKQ
jgi:diamine N-acetyltransferase